MTKRAVHRVYQPHRLVALGLLLLQLLGTLHFSLVPHRFVAGLSNVVHLRRLPDKSARAANATRPEPNRPQAVAGNACCEPETCPLGFSGPLSRLVAANEISSLMGLPESDALPSGERAVARRLLTLLNAPKTSPPANT